jgi:hypothetical protein
LEIKWQTSGLAVHHELFKEQRNLVTKLIKESKTKHFSDLVNQAKDQKELFSLMNKLMSRGPCKKLPVHTSSKALADKFANFFSNKISLIRKDIEEQHLPRVEDPMPSCGSRFSQIPLASLESITKVIKSCTSKSCQLDPVPTWIIKSCIAAIAPAIVEITNQSISSGIMPQALKQALVTPLIKKPSLNSEIFKNYRPISNLPFLSKVIEKHVDLHLTHHDVLNGLDDPHQSAYTKGSSTETALLKVQNDLLRAVDSKSASILILLDLSAAFDTIDHSTLLTRLNQKFGIEGSAISWITSYMSDRMQHVVVNGVKSEGFPLKFGVPQGSNFGPKAFKRYDRPLGYICEKHGVNYHIFADDTQIYLFFKPGNDLDQDRAITQIQSCIRDIKLWMSSNFLKLNEEKTEVLFIQSKHSKQSVHQSQTMNIGNAAVEVTQSARNLGVIFYSSLDMDKHVNNVCKRAFFEIRNISRIRKYLNDKAAVTLVHSFVTSKLDYCNALLYGLPDRLLQRLQRVLNCAARVVKRIKKYDNITPTLKDLHWLCVPERIQYKISLLTFKALHGLAPNYLRMLIACYKPERELRSTDANLLATPNVRLKSYGDRAFSKAAPECWNSLPFSLRSINDLEDFKRALKTHLFSKSFQ